MASAEEVVQARRSTAFKGLGRIDVHHHCFPENVEELAAEFGRGEVKFNVGFTGVFPGRANDHLRYMDENGIQTAIVTPSIKTEWHQDFPPEKLVDLCQRSLKAQLSYIAHNSLRFGAFALLPLPHIQETIAFIRSAVQAEIAPDGWGISTQIGKRYLGDPSFEPLWAELDKLKSVVFVHPVDSLRPENLPFGPFVQEFAFDTCRTITSLLASGFLLRYPNIKFLFAHNGGAFPFIADRIGAYHIDTMIMQNNNGMRLRELFASQNIYLDTALSSAFQFHVLKDLGIPKERLLYATDWPYTERLDDTGSDKAGYDETKRSGLFDDDDMEDIVRNNSLKLFPRLQKEFEKLVD